MSVYIWIAVRHGSRTLLAAGIALLLLFGTTSKDWVHQFAGHTDTVHYKDPSKGAVIEKAHHHCSFLCDVLAPFAAPAALSLPQPVAAAAPAVRLPYFGNADGRQPVSKTSRGPPAA